MDFINISESQNIIYNINIFDFIHSSSSQDLTILYFSNKSYKEIENINLYKKNIIYISKEKNLFSGVSLKKVNNSIISCLSKKTVIFIDINETVSFKYMEFLIRNLIKLFKILKKHNINLDYQYSNLDALCILSCNSDIQYFEDIVTCFKALLTNSLKEKYAIIYDKVCNYLDNEFQSKNLCEFCNDQCIASRNGFSHYKLNGCCYSYVYSSGGIILNRIPCRYLKDRHCTADCISCKLHTCYYLKLNNIEFKISNILLLKCFFSYKQYFVLKYNTFKKREQILEKLLHVNSIPTIFLYIFSLYRID